MCGLSAMWGRVGNLGGGLDWGDVGVGRRVATTANSSTLLHFLHHMDLRIYGTAMYVRPRSEEFSVMLLFCK